jgi:hypothetical protein
MTHRPAEYDLLVKTLLVGDSGVGKTRLHDAIFGMLALLLLFVC